MFDTYFVQFGQVLFSFWDECSKKESLGMVVILPLVRMSYLELMFSSLKQLILDQTRQNGYQTVPFGVYMHNLMFVFNLEYFKHGLGTVVILRLVRIGFL